MQKVLVTGATGTAGGAVVDALLKTDARVRALTRNPEAARLPREVEVMRGDLTDASSLDGALRDIDAVFLVWTAPLEFARAAIDMIAQHARRIVLLTSPHTVLHPLFQQPNAMRHMHAELERLVDASGVARTFLRPGMFAANARMWWALQVRASDVVRWPYGDAPSAPIDERDLGAVAALALLDARHEGKEYVITGPESLTHREQVATIGDVLGRTLQYEEMTPDEARREFRAPAAAVEMLLGAWAAAVGQPAYVTQTVEELIGRRARTFGEWVRNHAADFRA